MTRLLSGLNKTGAQSLESHLEQVNRQNYFYVHSETVNAITEPEIAVLDKRFVKSTDIELHGY